MADLPTSNLISFSHRSGSSDPYCLVKVDDEVVARYVVSGVGRGRDPGRRTSASQGTEMQPLLRGCVLQASRGCLCCGLLGTPLGLMLTGQYPLSGDPCHCGSLGLTQLPPGCASLEASGGGASHAWLASGLRVLRVPGCLGVLYLH